MNVQTTNVARLNAMREQFNQFTQAEKVHLALGLKVLAVVLRERDAREAKAPKKAA